MRDVCGVILAAGRGLRLKSDIPKYRHKIGGITLLDNCIMSLQEAGIKQLYVVLGPEERKSFKDSKNIIFVEQRKRAGTADAFLAALKAIPDRYKQVLLLYVDVALIKGGTVKNLLNRHLREKSYISVLTMEIKSPAGYGRIIKDALGRLKSVKEEDLLDEKEKAIKEVNVGAYVFKKDKMLTRFLDKIPPKGKKREKYLTEIFPLYYSKGFKASTLKLKDNSEGIGINDRVNLVSANRLIYIRNAEFHIRAGVNLISPEHTYIERAVSIGRDTTIYPFVYIESGVKIGRHCIISPSSRIRRGSIIKDFAQIGNFAEINRSKVGKHTKIKHFSYIGDACIGDNVNIGAGTVVANYDGKSKNKTIIRDNAFIGSNTTLVAPVEIGKGAVTGAGSVVTKNSKIAAGEVVVGVPARVLKKKSNTDEHGL